MPVRRPSVLVLNVATIASPAALPRTREGAHTVNWDSSAVLTAEDAKNPPRTQVFAT